MRYLFNWLEEHLTPTWWGKICHGLIWIAIGVLMFNAWANGNFMSPKESDRRTWMAIGILILGGVYGSWSIVQGIRQLVSQDRE